MTNQTLERSYVESLKEILNQQGIKAVDDIYLALQNKGYNYAGWGYGVATGTYVTGIFALEYMSAYAQRIFTPQEVSAIRFGMLEGYLDALLKSDDNKIQIVSDVDYQATRDFHKAVFERLNLSINHWTLELPMQIVFDKFGKEKREEIWKTIRQTQGDGLDSLIVSSFLVALVIRFFNDDLPNLEKDIDKFIENPKEYSLQEALYLIKNFNVQNVIFQLSKDDLSPTAIWLYHNVNHFINMIQNYEDAFRKYALSEFLTYIDTLKELVKIGDYDKENQDDKLIAFDKVSLNQALYGLGGNDTLKGGSGNDLLVGGKGFDTYHIEDHDTVYDSDGQGKIIFKGGFFSKDVEFSQAFEDTLNETWAYKVKGKTTHRAYKDGKDLIIMDLNNDHQVTVKDFFDVAVYQNNAYSALNIQLPSKPLNPDDEKYNIISANPDYVANIYASGSKQLKIFGSNQDDNIFANNRDLASIIKAGDGHDSVFGSNSKDEIFGGAGNDALYGSSGFLDFATANVPEEDHDIIIGNEGYDLISAGVGDDVIYVDEKRSHLIQDSSNRHGDWALGGKGDDTIHGGVGRDFLQGGAGADVIFAGSGDDVILGDGHIRFGVKSNTRYNLDTINSGYTNVGSGIHSLVGGVLSPTVSVTKGDTLSIEYRITNKDGKEILDVQEQQSAYTRDNKTFDWDIETIKDGLDYFINTHQEVPLTFNHHALESDNAHDILNGGLGNDLIIGQYGNDTLFGGEGNDILFGDDNRDLTIIGNDTLNGGKGNDKLYGGRGSDYLIASEGQDILDGGDDYDFYVFDYPALQDGLDKTIIDKQGQGQLSIAGTDWASKTWLNIDLNDKNHPDHYLTQDSALRSRLQDAPTWTDGTGSFIQVVGGELHIISRYFNSKIMIQSDEIQLGDGQTESRLPFNFKLESAKKNTAPEVANQYDDQLVTAGKAFSLLLANDLFNDADGDELNYQVSLANGQPLPTWLQFDANSKTLSGTAPSQSQVALKITATDPDGETAEQTFNLRTNSAPEVANQYSDQVVIADKVFNFALPNDLFNDADGDELNYQVSLANGQALPTWLQFDANSKTLSGTAPSQSQVALKITATDNYGETAEQTFNLRTNSAPELAEAFSPQYIVQPQRARQQVWTYQTAKHFKDIDQDQLQYSVHIKSAPSGITSQAVSINSSTGVLSLNQSFLQAGKYQLDITATDPHGQSYTATADINLVAPVSNPIAQISPQADIFNHIGFQQPSLFNPVRQAKGGETHGYFFNDNIQGIANKAHQISGKAGNDKLYGANLNDVLSGDAGHDTLYGLQGNDTLSGGLGNDILVGGQGNDVLIGGDGNDMYFYQRGDGLDYLIDTQGVDTLDLSQGRISLNDVLLKLDESNRKNAIVSFKHHQQSNNENEQLYIENWANAIEYIKTTEGIFDFKQLMQTVI